jgi:hypothetical protein
MAEQTRGVSVFLPRSEFDAFLFTEIWEDCNHMPLTVLLALARVYVDPWLEAAQLARLSSAAAAKRLASLIDAERNGPRQTSDPAATAVRLVALLPRRAVAAVVGAAPRVAAGKPDIHAIAVSLALLFLLLGIGWIMASRQSAERAAATAAAASPSAAPSPSGAAKSQ